MDDVRMNLRPLTFDEFQTCVKWAAGEGWNPGLRDAGCFFRCDPEGFIGGFVDGCLAGSISAVKYEGGFGFIGFFMVRPEYRSHLLGLRLGKAALERLDNFNVGVDGVERKIHNYQTHGFKLSCHNARYEGIADGKGGGGSAVPLSEIPFDKLLDFDALHFPARRERFLKEWISAEGHAGVAVEDGGGIAGYGLVRPCLKGFKIGPLFAKSAEVAGDLMRGLLAGLPAGSPFYLDVPKKNQEAVALAEGRGMKEVFRTARMYNRKDPMLPIDRIFGVTTFELG